MMWKRVAACTLAFFLMGSSVLFADSAYQQVRVWINGNEVDGGSYVINGKTYVPLREMDGLVDYNNDAKTVKLYKPNVHIFLFKGDTAFGNVSKGKLKFNVFTQVDNLETDIAAVKVAITDPSGSQKDIQSQNITQQKDNFWFRTYDFTYNFAAAGEYRVGFYMKKSKSSDYVLVSEKVITALNQ
ncbi:copper amine oxidase [Paenibacillus sp. Z6-24]